MNTVLSVNDWLLTGPTATQRHVGACRLCYVWGHVFLKTHQTSHPQLPAGGACLQSCRCRRPCRYVRYMGNIRWIQDYLVRKADKHAVPAVENTNIDRSVGVIHLTIMG